MILVIDVGNTNIVLGAYEEETLVGNWRITTLSNRTADETGLLICSLFSYSHMDIKKVESVIISSVVPNIMYSLTNGIRKHLHIEPMIVGVGMKTGINLKMENPKEMGADRIVNLVATKEIYGGPAIVVDYSTATVFDVVEKRENLLPVLQRQDCKYAQMLCTKRPLSFLKLKSKSLNLL